MKKYFEKKNDICLDDLMLLNPILIKMIGFFVMYSFEKKLPCTMTSLQSDHISVKRASRTHLDGRAVDFSAKGWSLDEIEEVLIDFNREFKGYGAISASDGVERAIIYHKVSGGEYHFHIQTKRIK